MYLKLNDKKTLIQIGYSKQEIADTRTEEKDEEGRDIITYGFDSGFSCVECTDEDENVWERLQELQDYWKGVPVTGNIFNIKWSDEKVDGSHLTGDDDAKDARLLAEEWTRIRAERDRLLTGCDWTQNNDSPCTAIDKSQWKTYRQELRDIPKEQSSAKTYEDITWPSSESI